VPGIVPRTRRWLKPADTLSSRRAKGRNGVASPRSGGNLAAMPSQFRLKRTVEFAETDMAGIMHFSNFFRWMEACETGFYRSLKLPQISFVPGQVVGWPRVAATCDFRAPLRFGESATVQLLVKRVGTRSVTYVFRFLRDRQLVARGEITAVCVQPDGEGGMVAAPLPPKVRAKLQVAAPRLLRD